MDLLEQLRAAAQRCTGATAAAEGLAAGLGQIGDIIVLLQPLRLSAQQEDDALQSALHRLAEKNFLTGTQAIGEGGLWAALVCGCVSTGHGFHAELTENEGVSVDEALFAPRPSRALVSTRPKAHLPLANFVERSTPFTAEAIGRVTARDIRLAPSGSDARTERYAFIAPGSQTTA